MGCRWRGWHRLGGRGGGGGSDSLNSRQLPPLALAMTNESNVRSSRVVVAQAAVACRRQKAPPVHPPIPPILAHDAPSLHRPV